MIKMIYLDPPVRGGRELRRHLNKVGLKSGYYSYFVNESDVPQRLIEKAGENVTIIKVDGRCTLASLKRAQKTIRRDLAI